MYANCLVKWEYTGECGESIHYWKSVSDNYLHSLSLNA